MQNARTIVGSRDNVNALIMAAQLEGCWSEVARIVVTYYTPEVTVLFRMTGASAAELDAWAKVIELSYNFEVRYVG